MFFLLKNTSDGNKRQFGHVLLNLATPLYELLEQGHWSLRGLLFKHNWMSQIQ